MTEAARTARVAAADALCRATWQAAGGLGGGASLVAVGGYGRRELAPCSDLDLVLLHAPSVDVTELAPRVWYPLWDQGVRLDHAVRSLDEVTDAAAEDVRVALGLLDARHVAGDPALTLRLRAEVLARWRSDARGNLSRLRDLVAERHARVGELAHAAVPDLKESAGGLRDATVLGALVATWLVDVPHADLERCRVRLLDLRDALQDATGRASDRVTPELWPALRDSLGAPDELTAQRELRAIGRRTAHLSRLTWSRVAHVLDPRRAGGRRPRLEPVAPGVAVAAGEVVLASGADPASDPSLLLRAAAAAAKRCLPLAPATAARLAATAAPLPEPWPTGARDALVRLLAAGPGLLPVWETLDETGALDLVLPEWERIRLLPHASPVHRFTVDRHVVETCVEAARLIRRVSRPDLLLVAALLHDIGKGGPLDHSVAGEPVAGAAARRMGFAPPDAEVVARLVRHHLLLATTATTRDLEDPATARAVAECVGDAVTLDLVAALTEADARATAPKAWTPWRAGLVRRLTATVGTELRAEAAPAPADTPPPPTAVLARVAAQPGRVHVEVEPAGEGACIRVGAADRVGLIADVAGALALLRLSVTSARAWTVEGPGAPMGVSEWQVDGYAEAPAVHDRLAAVASGRVDPAVRLRPSTSALPPSVLVRHEASAAATVIEVRTEDRPGVLHLACRALAGLDLAVRSAHIATLGPQSLDVFYVQEPGAGALREERAAAAAHAVRTELEGAATLGA